jgi:uncharacterized protein YhjY with autotransporter beta-barrel domain
MTLPLTFKTKLMLTTAMVGAFLGYSRRAYAACVTTGVSPNYLCSGYNATTQTITANNAYVYTASGFSINTNAGHAITITGEGELSFIDRYNSNITTTDISGYGLLIRETGNDGITLGSITVNANSDIIAGGNYGIHALNSGTGTLSITADGNVSSYNQGIYARNNNGTDLIMTTGAGSTITGTIGYGIYARNNGTGTLSITADGDVSGGSDGIYARNSYGTDLSITTGAGATITGTSSDGIDARNFGMGTLSIIAGGNVSGNTGGIYAVNFGTDLTITTGASTTITGSNRYGISARNLGTGSLSVTADGDVSGGSAGIFAKNYGTDLSITTGAGTAITGNNYGIYARNSGTGSLSVTADGDVSGGSGGSAGIFAKNYGTDLSITTGAGTAITGTNNYGIYAQNRGSGSLSITADGDVSGYNLGIFARNYNGTDLLITTGTGTTITGTTTRGIYARNVGTGSLSVTADGDVSSRSQGIYAYNKGADLTITTGAGTTITGTNNDGIYARNNGTGTLSIIADGDVSGGFYGIYARSNNGTDLSIKTGAGTTIAGTNSDGIRAENYDTGTLSITADGDVSGGRDGIHAYNNNNSNDLSITTGAGTTITGTNNYGIYAQNRGSGSLSITADGDVSGSNDGIFARNYGTDLSIATGIGTTITGTSDGIYARNYGTGILSITADGNVSVGGDGIYAHNSSGTDISITTGSGTAITGNNFGIYARNYGTGILSITVDGNVSGGSAGIIEINDNGTDLTITTGVGTTITGTNGYGILAQNRGSGSSWITADGDVSGGSGGILAHNYNGTDLSITTGAGTTITGTNNVGILAENDGTGTLSITANGDVSGSTHGIYAYNKGIDLTISTGASTTITGSNSDGIYAKNSGTGTLSITADGDVSGGSAGIFAKNYGTELSITTGAGTTITATSSDGIFARNYGRGSLLVTADGDVSGGSRGIAASNYNGTDLIITTDVGTTITGTNSQGIFAGNYGTGILSITANGSVVGGIGIYARNNNGTDLTITTGVGTTITGTSSDGILARNSGTFLSIIAYGDVSGGSEGIYARNYSGTDLSITTGAGTTITGTNQYGIDARNNGTGTLSIIAGGNVSGSNQGIFAYNKGADLTIATGVGTTITGTSSDGILAENDGTGILSIIAGGNVSGGNQGIYAYNKGTDLTITTGASTTITGTNNYGIYARNAGTGTLSIVADGDVSGNRGIGASNNNGTDLTITTGAGTTITGTNNYGIYARNSGTGTLSVTADGDVSGGGGIFARNYNGTDLLITTGAETTITGTNNLGIYARNAGTGSLSVTADGDVSGGGDGIKALNYNGTDLFITTGAGATITGTNNYGIYARNAGTGSLSVTADGDVSGGDVGIFARSYSGTDLTITTGANTTIAGTNHSGIYARNFGTGSLSITANGDVSGSTGIYASNNNGTDLSIATGVGTTITGTSSDGILARNSGTGLSIIADGNVSGGDVGIYARNYSGTDLSITTGAGTTITGNNIGIYARNAGTGLLNMINNGDVIGNVGIMIEYNGNVAGSITNNSGATIEGTGGLAIDLNDLTANLEILINGGRVIGDIIDHQSSNGNSTIRIEGDFTSDGNFDVSNFSVESGAVFTISANNSLTSQNAVEDNGDIIVSGAGSTIVGGLNVNNGGLLSLDEDFLINGDLANDGTVSISAGKTLTTDTMSAGTGVLIFGVTSEANHAQLTVIGGAANLTGQTISIDVAGSNSITNNDKILLVDGVGAIIGGPGNSATAVTDNSLLWNFKIIDGTGISTPTDNSDLFLIVDQSAPLTNLANTPNNIASGSTLIALEGHTANPQLLDILTNLNTAPDQKAFNDVLEAVQPAMDGGAVGVMQDVLGNTFDLAASRLEDIGEWNESTTGQSGFYESADTDKHSLVWATKFGNDNNNFSNDSGLGLKEWQQVFGQTSQQGRRDGIDGYNSHTVGGAFGADTGKVFENETMGIAFSYADTQVNSENVNNAKSDIDSYQATLYGDHKLGKDGYLSGMAAYALNNNNTERFNVGGVPNLTARGDFASNQIALRTEIGRHINFGNYTLTPNATLNWMHYTSDDYTETGAGGANLNVKTKSLDSLESGIGIKASTKIILKDQSIVIPTLQLGYRYGVINDAVEMTSSFTGGGAAFQTQGADPARNMFNAELSTKYIINDKWDLTASYTFDYKQDYTAHAGLLMASYKF